MAVQSDRNVFPNLYCCKGFFYLKTALNEVLITWVHYRCAITSSSCAAAINHHPD